MAKRALISGYVGFSNFGDDLIFLILTRHLKALGFDVSALSSNPALTQKAFKVNSYGYKNFLEVIKAIMANDYLISGGGSLFQNATSNKSLLYYILIIFLAKFFGKKVLIFAHGIGPINGFFLQWLTKIALKISDFVTVRDVYSYRLLSRWGIKSQCVNDPAWDIPIVAKENPNCVGIQLRSYKKMHPIFLKQLAKYVGIYFSDKKIMIFPFQASCDVQICREFERELKKEYPHIQCEIQTAGSTKLIIENFAKLERLIAMRFHACLLGLKYKVNTMALSYDVKVENLAKEYNLVCIDTAQKPDDYNDVFRRFMEQKVDTRAESPRFDWRMIDEFLLK